MNVYEVWQDVGESVDGFPGFIGGGSLGPLKSLESAAGRSDDGDEYSEGCAIEVDAAEHQFLEVFK